MSSFQTGLIANNAPDARRRQGLDLAPGGGHSSRMDIRAFMTPTICRMARAALDISAEALGEAVGLHRNTISAYERTGRTLDDGDEHPGKPISNEAAAKLNAFFVKQGLEIVMMGNGKYGVVRDLHWMGTDRQPEPNSNPRSDD